MPVETTYDLSACCCDWCGCSDTPTTLSATAVSGGFSATFGLTRSGATYTGDFTCNTCAFRMTLSCSGGMAIVTIADVSGVDPAACSDCEGTSAGVSPTCSPFQVSATVNMGNGASCNTECGSSSSWTVTIVE